MNARDEAENWRGPGAVRTVLNKVVHYAEILRAWGLRRSVTLDYAPEDVSIEVTNNCNFRCEFCPQSDPRHHQLVPRTILAPADAEKLLVKLRRGGVRTNVMHWTLDGEPFMNKQFHLICGLGHKYGFNNQIFATNGFFVSAERLRALPVSPNAKYTLCIDYCADPEFFESCRGTKGSWERVLENIRGVVADPALRHIHLQLTDISSYKVSDPAAQAEAQAALRRLLPQPEVRIRSRVFHNMTGHVVRLQKKRSKRYHLCPYPWMSLVVSSNGDVVACCRDLQHKTVLGNLFRQELPEIWNGDAARALRQALIDQEPARMDACRNCDLPWDEAKFDVRHLTRTALRRLQILSK